MAKGKQYQGSFVSRDGIIWRAEIWVENFSGGSATSLVFPAESPLVIEWEEAEKEKAVIGSSCTLKVESMTDREFINLYSIAPRAIRLDVYRGASLYWTGCLDPEFYEEPYAREKGYDVTLTFSDFGVLDRTPYALAGYKTIDEIVRAAISAAGIELITSQADIGKKTGVNFQGITTYINGRLMQNTPLTTSSVSLPSENFYDEDGEPQTYLQALEAILQPLALRMIQRHGVIYIYDLNSLRTSEQTETEAIEWAGEDQVLGVDSVYNNVKITFSPYSSAELLDGETTYSDSDYSAKSTTEGTYTHRIYEDYGNNKNETTDVSFMLYENPAASYEGWGYIDYGNYHPFGMLSVTSGSDEQGVLVFADYTRASLEAGGTRKISGHIPMSLKNAKNRICKSAEAYIPALFSSVNDYYLRLEVPMLLDPRYNFTEEAGGDNEKGKYENYFKKVTSYAFVPAMLVLEGLDGNTYYYSNEGVVTDPAQGYIKNTTGQWLTSGHAGYDSLGTYFSSSFWLSWYDPSDIMEGCGVGGWQTNRQTVGAVRPGAKVPLSATDPTEVKFKIGGSILNREAGQYIKYPPVGGHLYLYIYEGIWCISSSDLEMNGVYPVGNHPSFGTGQGGLWFRKGYYNNIRWWAFKAPKISVVTSLFSDPTMDDIEYSAYVSTAAKETLEISTTCGTVEKENPSARGAYLYNLPGNAFDQVQISSFKRAGNVGTAEQLLLNTLYSQYAERHQKLSGTCKIATNPVGLFTDDADLDDSRVMIATAISEDVITGEASMTFVELSPDEYVPTTNEEDDE